MTTANGFTPIRAKSNGRYLCDYDPVRHLLQFRRGDWEEVIDLSEYVTEREPVEALPVSAIGYVLLPVDVARLVGLVSGVEVSKS